jgi:mono/diheme cytochrome c family protein
MKRWVAMMFVVAVMAQASRSVWDGAYTEEQANRGASAYAKECAGCHGTALTGGEEAPPLSGGGFVANWNGLTLGDLFERTRTTMPQNDPSRVSRQGHADILAYVLSVNKFPAGKAELEPKAELLRGIRFEAEKK